MDQSPAAAALRLAYKEQALISAVFTGDTETVVDLLDGGVPIDTKDDEGMSLLHWAAWGGHVTTMRLLIRRGCDVDSVDDSGATPLHCAAAMRQTKAVRELIRNGASKSVLASEFGSPLHQAALYGHMDTAIAMLEEGCPLDAVAFDGSTVLYWAAEGGNVELVRELVCRGCDVNASKRNGCTPLHRAAACGNTEAVQELIKLGASRSVVAKTFGTPLHQTATYGHVETVVAMLEEGCPLDIVNNDESTVLHFAATGGNVEVVRELVGRGCDVNAVKANGCTPLHNAAGRGRTEAVCELIKLGATKSVVASTFGTPLHQAAFEGHVETAVAMLEVGCPFDVEDSDGCTVLHWAAEGGNVELVRELVGRGCDVNAVEANGFTPLHDAAACGKTEAVHELIKLGATKAVVAGNCGTPLHQAALKGHVDTAVALLEEGCPLYVVSSDGATVLHFAAERGHVGVMQELVDRGCDVNAVKANGFTPLHAAAVCGRTEAVRELIKLGAAKAIVASMFGTPLHQAAINGHVETAVAMLEEECPLDVVDSDGATVLHFAAERGHVGVMKELVGRGCEMNAVKANGFTPLHSAAVCGRTEAVRELIKLGANQSVVAGNCGTPLHQAALYRRVDTTVAMLEEGCPLDVVSSAGATVLHFAAEGGHIELVTELVRKGCDVNAVKADGCTPLHSAAGCGRTEAVRELIKLGAAKSVIASTYGTPLHQAALKGRMDTAVAMLEEGCPLDLVSSAGSTVLHAAAAGGLVELVKVLVGRGCDVNAVKANGYTPLHDAAEFGRVEAVRELINLGATKSVVAGIFGTPLHQAILNGFVETVEALLKDELCEPDLTSHDVTPTNSQVLESGIIGTCDSYGRTPVMWAVHCGEVEVFKLLTSKRGTISDRDTHSLSAFEHCFVGGQASKLSQFREACGIESSGEGLRGALATLITQRLVDAHKVLCLCAISGDSVLLEDQFTELVANHSVLPGAVKYAKLCFSNSESESAPFLNQLSIPDESTLNPLHISLLSLKCYKMGFAADSVKCGAKDHTSFITKLLSHPVLKETVHENFPNGLSPLDLARQFELHQIAALIEVAGGCPGVWADIPQKIEARHPLALPQVKEAYPSMKAIAEDGEHGRAFIMRLFSNLLQQPLWHPKAATVGAGVGAKSDDHEYKSLNKLLTASVNDVSDLVDDKCRRGINAMLNHHKGGSIHFGIHDDGIVEKGLDLEQNHVIDKLKRKVSKVLQNFWPPVESDFAQVEPVDLYNDKYEPTNRWRFDIVVKPHKTVVQVNQKQSGWYRHGAKDVRMTYAVFVQKIRAEVAPEVAAFFAEDERASLWDEKAASIVGADVGAEREDHEYKSLMGPVDGVNQPLNSGLDVVKRATVDKCRQGINAMLNYPTGGIMHFGIHDDGIVEEGLAFDKNHAIDELRRKVGDVLQNFWPPVESSFAQVEPVKLWKDKLTSRWRFDIVVKPHPMVVLFSKKETAYYRQGPQNSKMTHNVLAQRVRRERAVRSVTECDTSLVVSGGAVTAERTPPIRLETVERTAVQVVAVSGPFRPVSSSTPVVSGGAVAAERSPPVCEATHVQVVQKHAEEFLEKMDSKVIAPQLRALELIPESVEYDILHSKTEGNANAHLLKHLKVQANVETVKEVFRIASKETGYGKMSAFAAGMLKELQ